jgi:hypothetical protein
LEWAALSGDRTQRSKNAAMEGEPDVEVPPQVRRRMVATILTAVERAHGKGKLTCTRVRPAKSSEVP